LDHYPPVEEDPPDRAFQRAMMPTPEQLVAIMQPKFGLFDSTELGLDAWHYWENFGKKYHKDSKKAFPGNMKSFSRINMETRATLESQ
jgi:hypothetical protein